MIQLRAGQCRRWLSRDEKDLKMRRRRICSAPVVVLFVHRLTRRFGLIGDDATDEVGRRTAQRRHQVIQLLL